MTHMEIRKCYELCNGFQNKTGTVITSNKENG